MIARGHQVTMVCGSGQNCDSGVTTQPNAGVRRADVEGIDVIEICLSYSNYDGLLKRSFTFFRYAWKSIFIAWHEKYDLLFATSTPLTAGIPGIVMRLLKPRKKFVFEVRDLWPELPKAMGVIKNPLILGGMSILEKVSYLSMHAGVALSPGIHDGMRRRTNDRKLIEVVPNGCDLETFGPNRETLQPPNSTLPAGFPRDGLRCVFTGAHGIANGIDAVLDAAKVLQSRGRNDIHLIFIGDGSQKPRLQDRCEREQLSNCHFFPPMPKDQLCKLMNHVDVGLMILANVPAFYYGTSPNKFFDYIATGLPVLNNYPGWLAELIENNECGVVVEPEDPEAFAEGLQRLADDHEKRRSMGKNARLLAEKDFDRKELADQLVDFLERIAEM